jgi:xyloglucan galactosyltransferase MUR3
MKLKVFSFLFFSVLVSYTSLSYFTSNLDVLIKFETQKAPSISFNKCDPDIAPFYIYDLPDRLNKALLNNCTKLDPWLNKCPYIENDGLGQPLYKKSIWHKTHLSWYNTYQFSADMIFHARAVNHPCRTYNLSDAFMFYIPFYPSLYAPSFFLEMNFTRRDAMGVDLVDYLSSFPTFQRHGGHDHFLVSGIMVQDLVRKPAIRDAKSYRSNKLLDLPKLSNVSVLIIERKQLHKYKNHFGIPYPSYFHPRSKAEMISWQNEVRRSKRTHLFSFVGGARQKGHISEIYRTAVIDQCKRSKKCLLVFCKYWVSAWNAADEILGAMKKSRFCLQPPGDTATRRSVFDSILAGCVPVFFTELMAYSQYEWYIPENREDWSVFIRPEQLFQIENLLSRIPEKEVQRMREAVIAMIPQVTYAYPSPSATQAEIGFHDAVDTALIELTKRVQRIKQGAEAGANLATFL